MNFKEVVRDELFEMETRIAVNPKKKTNPLTDDSKGKLISGKKSLLLLDIDDSLLTANIKIWKVKEKQKDGSYKKLVKPIALTPAQYAKLNVTKEDKINNVYDYKEFQDASKVRKSILKGKPIIGNLRTVDSYIGYGWQVGILTARGMEDVVASAIADWLMYKDKFGKLHPIGKKLLRSNVFAINTKSKQYTGITDADKKREVIRGLRKKYDRIVFLDDDESNLKAIRGSGIKGVTAKKAKEK